MPTSATGIVYPASSDDVQLWDHFANMAASLDTIIEAIQAKFADGSGIPFAQAAGTISITPSAANTPTSGTVTLPVGRFTQAPIVTTGTNSTVPGITVTGWAASSSSTTSVLIWLTRTNTTSTGMTWVAVQMTSTTAGG